MWEYFKQQLIRPREWHVPARMKNKCGKLREPWMTRDVMTFVKKKKEAYEMTKMIDEGKVVDVVYMGLSKAVDKVPHVRLVQKVMSHDIG
eukprot:g42465.t1